MLNNTNAISILLFVFVCIAAPWILKSIKTSQPVHFYPDPPSPKTMTILDQPVSFGYQCIWFAVRPGKMERLTDILNLCHVLPCNWQTGIEKAYNNYVFITPPINGWTLACGLGLSGSMRKENIEMVKEILQDLSMQYGEAQFFCTQREAEYHCCMKAVEGFVENPVFLPDGNAVMKVAENWSIDPSSLENRMDIPEGLGLLAES